MVDASHLAKCDIAARILSHIGKQSGSARLRTHRALHRVSRGGGRHLVGWHAVANCSEQPRAEIFCLGSSANNAVK